MKFPASVIFVSLLVAVQGKAQTSSEIRGDYVEARSAHVYTCGCLYSGEMVTGGKEAILVWHITSGEYQGIPLSSLKIAAVIVGEQHLGVDGTARRTVLYFDGLSSNVDQQAILELWRREYAKILGKIIAGRPASIRIEKRGETESIEISGMARLEVRKARLPQDAHPGSSLWYGPFTDLGDPSLITALLYEYWGNEFQRQWREFSPGISGFMGHFSIASGI